MRELASETIPEGVEPQKWVALRKAYQDNELYAAMMERRLELIRLLCAGSESEMLEIIELLTHVRDPRSTIWTGL